MAYHETPHSSLHNLRNERNQTQASVTNIIIIVIYKLIGHNHFSNEDEFQSNFVLKKIQTVTDVK